MKTLSIKKASIIDNKLRSVLEQRLEKKFSSWDEVERNNWLLEGTPEQKQYAAKLLADPTIYMYAFFRNSDGSRRKLFYYQDAVINDDRDRILFIAARQIGKSEELCSDALIYALQHPGTTVLMVSLTLPQSKDLLRKIKNLLQFCILDSKTTIGDTENKTEIYFKHYRAANPMDGKLPRGQVFVELPQSRIVCVPATDAARGYSADRVYIDEIAFYPNARSFYYEVIEPTTYATNGKIKAFTNPNGRQGVAWEFWSSNRWNKYRFNFLDCPLNTKEKYDLLCKELTRHEIDSSLNAEFTDPAGGFFSYEERRVMQSERPNMLPAIITQPLFIFFDFAKVHDRTVRTIGVPVSIPGSSDGVYVYEMKEYPERTPYNSIIDELSEFVQKIGFHNIAMIGWDNTGVGQGISDFVSRLEKLGIKCMPVEFSEKNKSRMYTMFKVLAERSVRGEKALSIPFVTECDKQLAGLVFERSSRGYLHVHHQDERDRDDYPDAICGLISLIINPDSPPVNIDIVGEDNTPINETLLNEYEQNDTEFDDLFEQL